MREWSGNKWECLCIQGEGGGMQRELAGMLVYSAGMQRESAGMLVYTAGMGGNAAGISGNACIYSGNGREKRVNSR